MHVTIAPQDQTVIQYDGGPHGTFRIMWDALSDTHAVLRTDGDFKSADSVIEFLWRGDLKSCWKTLGDHVSRVEADFADDRVGRRECLHDDGANKVEANGYEAWECTTCGKVTVSPVPVSEPLTIEK